MMLSRMCLRLRRFGGDGIGDNVERLIELAFRDDGWWCDGEHVGVSPFREDENAGLQAAIGYAQRASIAVQRHALQQTTPSGRSHVG